MKILLTGSNGQLGSELRLALAPLGTILPLDRSHCDLRETDTVRSLVRDVHPDIIVNAAAFTAVDAAQSDHSTAFAVNATAPGILGEEAARIGALVVHYSTDYVFDGSGDGFRSEDAPTAPLNAYGASKLAGERNLAQACPDHLIFRTSWVFGLQGSNFLKTMLSMASQRERINIVDDQIGAPTSAALIADMTARGIAAARAATMAPGCYHLAAAGQTSWYAYACHVIAKARASNWPVRLAADGIVPVCSDDYPSAARRPLNSRLDTRKLRHALGLELEHWRDGVDRVMNRLI